MEASVRAAGATRLGSAAPLSQPFRLSLHHLHTAFGDVSPRNFVVLRLCENITLLKRMRHVAHPEH